MREDFKRYAFMIVACFSYAMSLDLFLVPNRIVTGGVTGLATMISILTGLGVGAVSICANLPILLIGLKTQGHKFIVRCLLTTIVLGIFIDLFKFLPPLTMNPLLASIYAGIAQGIGIGLFYTYQVSSGGTELLARVMIGKFKKMTPGTMLTILDGVVVIVGSTVMKNAENILMALIVIFLSGKVCDIIITGIDSAKMCYIITDYQEEISKILMENSPRGITALQGKGMYTKSERSILMTAIKSNQLLQLKELVFKQDPNAFIIVSETTQVRGNGFKDILE